MQNHGRRNPANSAENTGCDGDGGIGRAGDGDAGDHRIAARRAVQFAVEPSAVRSAIKQMISNKIDIATSAVI